MTAEQTGVESFDLAVLLDEQTLVLIGRLTGLPAAAAVISADQTRKGQFRSLVWMDEDRGSACIAVLRLEGIALTRTSDLLLTTDDGASTAMPGVVRLDLGPEALVQTLKAEAAHRAGDCFDFLRVALFEDARGDTGGRIRHFLHTLLHECSTQDGFVEVFARPECGGLFLQGWSIHLPAGGGDLWLETGGLAAYEAVVGHFHRPDLLDTAQGMVAFMLKAVDFDPASIRRIYFRSRAGYHHLNIVDQPARFEGADGTRHVAGMLPRIEAPGNVISAFKRICRPRYEHRETVSTMPYPVRVAVDCALHVADAGFFLSGWMLDPARLVSRLLLKSTAGFYARLDANWSRLQRPDVSAGFAADALIGPKLRPREDAHGFAVFTPRDKPIAQDERFYLEVVIEDEDAAFMPMDMADAGATTAIRDMLAGQDLEDPAVEQLIARHIAPAMAGMHAARAVPATADAVIEFGKVHEPALSIVMPLSSVGGDIDVWFARMAPDADTAKAEIILVAPRAGSERQIGRFRRLTEFYRLNGKLLLTTDNLERHEALELGARQSTAERLLFLSPNVLPKEAGWIRRLLRDHASAERAGALCPTLMYEDYSIRYAGRDPSIGDMPHRPSDRSRYIGYSRHWIEGDAVKAVGGLTSECCLISRRVFEGVGGFARDLVGAAYKDDDLSLRLRAAGAECLWSSAIELYALDDAVGDHAQDQWARACQLIDRWRFVRKWVHADRQPETLS